MADQEFTTDELATEEWRDVVGYEGIYSVSNLGRVRRDAPSRNSRVGRPMNLAYTKRYVLITLSKNTIQKSHSVHALVAAAFIGPRPDNQEVNHKDTNKHNNRSSNLEYQTRLGNAQHAAANGLYLTGESHPHYRQPDAWPKGNEHWTRKHPDRVIRGDRHPAHQHPETKRGELNGRATVTEDQVRAIRQRFLAGVSISELARSTNKSWAVVSNIVKRKTWAHVT